MPLAGKGSQVSLMYWTIRTQSNLGLVALSRDDSLNADMLAIHHDAVHHKAQ